MIFSNVVSIDKMRGIRERRIKFCEDQATCCKVFGQPDIAPIWGMIICGLREPELKRGPEFRRHWDLLLPYIEYLEENVK